jgi:ketosteroid isomerase-like protein
MNATQWVDRFQAHWRARDPHAVAALFTDKALYYQGPYSEPRIGREAIATHWAGTLSRQKDPVIWFGSPLAAGDRATVEWWCILHDPATGTPRNAAGCLVLRFDTDGLCTHYHEYWHSAQDSTLQPPQGWME